MRGTRRGERLIDLGEIGVECVDAFREVRDDRIAAQFGLIAAVTEVGRRHGVRVSDGVLPCCRGGVDAGDRAVFGDRDVDRLVERARGRAVVELGRGATRDDIRARDGGFGGVVEQSGRRALGAERLRRDDRQIHLRHRRDAVGRDEQKPARDDHAEECDGDDDAPLPREDAKVMIDSDGGG